jgi:hypothetical protein
MRGNGKRWWNVNRRGVFAGTALAAVLVGIMAVGGVGSAFTGLGVHANGDPTYRCLVQGSLVLAVGGPPMGSDAKRVLSIVWEAVNDEDSGFAGYWALDTYRSTVNVWSIGAGTYKGDYYWEHTYTGLFQVPQGGVSPGETGTTPNAVPEPAAGYGTFVGGDWGYIVGGPSGETFMPVFPVSGILGDKNYGGTTADLLLGTYGAGQTGAKTPYSWYAAYFSPADPTDTNLLYGLGGNAWGFVYTLNVAFQTNPHGGSPSVNQWCNFGAGAAGDIVTAA